MANLTPKDANTQLNKFLNNSEIGTNRDNVENTYRKRMKFINFNGLSGIICLWLFINTLLPSINTLFSSKTYKDGFSTNKTIFLVTCGTSLLAMLILRVERKDVTTLYDQHLVKSQNDLYNSIGEAYWKENYNWEVLKYVLDKRVNDKKNLNESFRKGLVLFSAAIGGISFFSFSSLLKKWDSLINIIGNVVLLYFILALVIFINEFWIEDRPGTWTWSILDEDVNQILILKTKAKDHQK